MAGVSPGSVLVEISAALKVSLNELSIVSPSKRQASTSPSANNCSKKRRILKLGTIVIN